MKQHKVTASERLVLEKLVFPESFEVVRDETRLQHGELRDDLINLLSFGFVEACEQEGEAVILSTFYDSDNLQDFMFRATSKGLSAIKKSRQ